MNTKIYLWTDGDGWNLYEVTDITELEKRNIQIGDGARIGNGAWIGDGARIGNGARIGDGANIGDNESPIIVYIIGSRYPVSYWGEDRIDIGCENHTIDQWLTQGEMIAKRNGLTEVEIAEYTRYVEMIAAIHEADKEDV